MKEITGIVFNIQRYSLHDGLGIRTIVFFKGCPLQCSWCSNPESQSFEPEQMGSEVIGYTMTAQEATDQVKRDMPFFKRSGGGITLSGGEPLAQPDFAREILRLSKAEGINTAIETTCFAETETFLSILKYIDYLMADIKVMDCKRHIELTGVSNEIILKNISLAAQVADKLVVRVPVIPSINNDWANLSSIAEFCTKKGIERVELLPYHNLGMNKYKRLGRQYLLGNIVPMEKNCLQEAAAKLSNLYKISVGVP